MFIGSYDISKRRFVSMKPAAEALYGSLVPLNQLAQAELALLEKQLAVKQRYYKNLIEKAYRM